MPFPIASSPGSAASTRIGQAPSQAPAPADPDADEGRSLPDPDSQEFATGQKGDGFPDGDPVIAKHLLEVAQDENQAVASGKLTLGPKLQPLAGAASYPVQSPTTDPTLADTTVNSGRPRNIVEDPLVPGTFFVAGCNSGVEKTDGKAWVHLSNHAPSESTGWVAVDPTNDAVLYEGLGDPFSTSMPGLLKSTDGGHTWSDPVVLTGTYPGAAAPVTATATRDIEVSPDDPNLVLVATNVGLFRSTDAGNTFSLVVIPPDQGPGGGLEKGFWGLQRVGPDAWVASARSGGVGALWTSSDGGATWSRATMPTLSGGTPGRITLAAAKSTVGTANPVVYALVGSSDGADTVGLLKSTDGGKTWSEPCQFNAQGQPENPTQDQPDLNVLHDQAWYNQALLVDPKNPDNVAVGGNLALVSSNDGGQTFRVESDWAPWWSGMAPRQYAHADMHGGLITYDAQGKMKVVLLTDGGLFTTDDKLFTGAPGEARWSSAWNRGRDDGLYQSVAMDGAGREVMGGLQDNGTWLTQGGRSVQVSPGDGFGAAIGQGGQQLIASYNGHLRRSSDGGKTWSSAMTGLPLLKTPDGYMEATGPFDVRVRALPGDSTGQTFVTVKQTVVTAPDGTDGLGPGGVFKTTDGGASWSAVPAQVTRRDGSAVQGIPGNVIDIDVSRKDPNLWAVVTDGGFVYTTKDGGSTFTESAQVAGTGTALPTEAINSVEFDPKDPTGNTLYAASGTGWGQYTDTPGVRPSYLFKTTDGGGTWAPVQGGLPNVQCNEVRFNPADPTRLYAATVLGLYRSLDDGATWTPYAMPKVDTTGVAVTDDGTQLVAGTYGRGLYQGVA